MALIATHLNAGVIQVVTVYQAIGIESPSSPTSICPSRINMMVSVDVKHYEIKKECCSVCRVQELCRGGRPGLLVPNKPASL